MEAFMKNIYKIILLSFLLIFIGIVSGVFRPDAAQSKIITNVPADISEDQLKAIVIEDFENAGNESKWLIEAIPKKLDKPKKPEDNPVHILELKFIDGSPSDMVPEAWAANNMGLQNKKCLGVHFQFMYPGYNSVHIIPTYKIEGSRDPSGRLQEREGIKLPGRAKGISLWFHGRGHPYTLECWVEDYTGEVHILKFGSVNFVGWRPLKAYIPVNIPQKMDSYPQTRFLAIKRFVLRAEPTAQTQEIYMFIDQIKVLTDEYEVNFDGKDLEKAFGGNKGQK